MNISYQSHIKNAQKILKEFLFLAIYTPPGEKQPEKSILDDPLLARYYQKWGQKDDHALFAITQGRTVGVCWSRCFPMDAPGYGSVAPHIPELSIAVLPEYRGKGIGTSLLDQFLGSLQSHTTAVSLSVDASNPARVLYQRFGFMVCHHKGSSLIMIKEFF